MVMTHSEMLALGTAAPSFALPDPDGRIVSLSDHPDAKAYVVVFMCNHCPFVKHLRDQLAAFARECEARGALFVGINANDADRYPDDAPDRMKEEAQTYGYTFPYLIDETQEVAKAYKAACTPDFFLFDSEMKLAYRGQFDGSRPSNDVEVTGDDLRAALTAVLAGEAVAAEQVPSVGCTIKWKPGGEPEWFG
jgi:peroxiredoxin